MVGDVSVRAQPEVLADAVRFSVAFNTHTVDLSSYDASQNLRLRSNGEEIAPISSYNAAGEGPGAHHREIFVVFPANRDGAFTLVVGGLASGDGEISWP